MPKSIFELDKLIDPSKLEKNKILVYKERIIVSTKTNMQNSIINLRNTYSLYGEKIENFLMLFLDPQIRAIDKTNISLQCQEIYKTLFNRVSPKNFIFNETLYIENHIPLPAFIEDVKHFKSKEEFEEVLKARSGKYFHIEVDFILKFIMRKKTPLFSRNLLFESKMYTVPLAPTKKQKLSILKKHLSKAKLREYLILRNLDYYILMTFGYLYKNDETKPLGRGLEGNYINNLPSAWVIHLSFINKNALKFVEEYKGIDEIEALAESIIESVCLNQAKLLVKLRKEYQLPKDINFRITYNVIKVVLMYQYMIEKDEQIKELSKQIEELQKKLAKEQEMRKKEQEMRKKEQE
ncbi:MAG: hypothetical protein ACTSRZ_17175, partial [Promethearchaeota archaeon]